MSLERNTPAEALRPLTARSVIASLLLGMHPPRASGALLVRWARLVGVADGTARAALSRMVAAGELVTRDGRYELAGGLRTRQGTQDWSLEPALRAWDGRWLLLLVHDRPRGPRARAEFRAAARSARLGERRDGVWLRPDNLPPEATAAAVTSALAAQASRWSARPEALPGSVGAADGSAHVDVEAVFGLVATAQRMEQLTDDLLEVTGALRAGSLDRLGAGFALGAAALLEIRRDPLLPVELCGVRWPGDALRRAYRAYRETFGVAVRSWFLTEDRAG